MPNKSKHKYKLTYSIKSHQEGIDDKEKFFEAHKIEKEDVGATDMLFTASVIYPEDGSLSVMFSGLDGRTGKDIDDSELFKIWSLLAKRLSESETLDEGRKFFAKMTFEDIRDAILSARSRNVPSHRHGG